MIKIIPTIFAISKQEFDEKFNKLTKISKELQIDFMDGHFVRSKSIKLSDVPNLRNFDNKFEAHLMVRHPETWIKRLKNKGFQKVIFHYSSLDENEIIKLIDGIHKLDMEAFIAINPEIREDEIFDFLNKIDGVLIMGVKPGKEKQHILTKTYYKLENLRRESKKIPLQVDGGVNLYTIKELVKSGATILNSGSFISRAENPIGALNELYEVVKRQQIN